MHPGPGYDDGVRRFRAAAELIAHPALRPYKHSVEDMLSEAARAHLRRASRALLSWIWTCVENKYGISRSAPFCAVFRAGSSPFCTLALTPDALAAVQAAAALTAAWPEHAFVIAVVAPARNLATYFSVSSTHKHVTSIVPEAFLPLAAALSFQTPPWLHH